MSRSQLQLGSESESPKKAFWAPVSLVLGVVLFLLWYSIAANYDYSALAGTYRFHENQIRCTLKLHKDGTFQQTIYYGTKLKQADGTWHRIGEGGVDFSVGFLPLPGAKTFLEEFPGQGDGSSQDHSYYGHFEKVFGLYPLLRLNAKTPGPTLYKVPFS